MAWLRTGLRKLRRSTRHSEKTRSSTTPSCSVARNRGWHPSKLLVAPPTSSPDLPPTWHSLCRRLCGMRSHAASLRSSRVTCAHEAMTSCMSASLTPPLAADFSRASAGARGIALARAPAAREALAPAHLVPSRQERRGPSSTLGARAIPKSWLK